MNDHGTDEPIEDIPVPGPSEWNVLNRVLGISNDRHPWSVDELIRDLGDAGDVKDAINTLYGAPQAPEPFISLRAFVQPVLCREGSLQGEDISRASRAASQRGSFRSSPGYLESSPSERRAWP
jgi:hypothetical protein